MPDSNRVVHLTDKQKTDLNELIALKDDIAVMVDLLKQMRAAFKVFIAIGHGLKWLATCIATVTALYYFVFKRDSSLLTAIFRAES